MFELAEGTFKRHPKYADRYVKLAWKLKTRYNLKLHRITSGNSAENAFHSGNPVSAVACGFRQVAWS